MFMHTLRLATLCGIGFCSIPLHADYTIIAGWDRQLFPAYIIATASIKPAGEAAPQRIGDPHGQIGICVAATRT